ncbi:MAG TPA: glycosyltransferase family 39 protein [Thermomicrobiaceae bacterium]|nr:glycosyltransferase family 39 protein [Thermomicrobiaceae bacterium]
MSAAEPISPLPSPGLAAARPRAWLRSSTALLILLALVDFAGHLAVAGNYGYFRDELYFLAAGRHLAFGYVDFPPLIALLGRLMQVSAGDNLFAIHVIPALAGALLVVVTGLMAREFDGGYLAQGLAALGSMVALVLMATASIFSMDVLDELWWALAAYLVIRLIRRDEPRLWLLVGLVCGIGLTTKLTMLFFGFALTLGLALSPSRRYFRSRWLYLGGLIAAAFLLPYILWNARHAWPTWEFWHHYGGLTGGGPLGFLANQILAANPFTLPLTIGGLIFFFRHPAGRPYRALGWTFVILYLLFTLINAKSYFLLPAYPMLFAGGACLIAGVAGRPRWRWLRWGFPALLVLSGILLAPLAMPVLSPALYARSYSHLSGAGNSSAGQDTAGVFPQYLGDRFGWPELAATMAAAYHQLSPAEQAQACIFTANYGEASALNHDAARYGLPPAISGHNNYFLWGPGRCSGSVLLTVGLSRSEVEESFASAVHVATTSCRYCVAGENGLPVYLATQPRFDTVDRAWPRVKHFD